MSLTRHWHLGCRRRLRCGARRAWAADEIVVGFATAESGFMQAYDKPAQDAAMIRIDEINKAGGLLGKQIKVGHRRHQDRPRRGRQGRPRGARQGRRAGDRVLRLRLRRAGGARGGSGRQGLVLPVRRIDQGRHPGRRPAFLLGLGAGGRAGRDHGRMGLQQEECPQLLPPARHLDGLQQGHLRRLRLDAAAPEGCQARRQRHVQERGCLDRLADHAASRACRRNPMRSCSAR